MALATYDNIAASIADWLNRSDLTDQIPDFITLASNEAQRKLDVPITKQVMNQTVTSSIRKKLEMLVFTPLLVERFT